MIGVAAVEMFLEVQRLGNDSESIFVVFVTELFALIQTESENNIVLVIVVHVHLSNKCAVAKTQCDM